MQHPLSGSARLAHTRNLQRLCVLRSILILTLVLAALLAQFLLAAPLLTDPGIQLALAGLTLLNALTVWRLWRGRAASELELLLQLGLDVLLMTLVFYRTGGSTNPFVFYYLVPLTIASAILRQPYALGLAALTLLAYTVLLFHYQPFQPLAGHELVAPEMSLHHHHADLTVPQAFNLHVFGMWLNFVLSAALITFFVGRMSSALREQDRQMAEQHERLLQKEQIVAMGAMAAAAAHELGTPLNTMTVLVQELEAELPPGAGMAPDIRILREQLGHCRQILNGLREQARQPEQGRWQTLWEFGQGLQRKMEILHPGRHFSLRLGSGGEVRIRPSLMLQQVVMNLLNNAGEAAIKQVDWRLELAEGEFRLDIWDDGLGLDPAVAERLGQPFVSSKPDGMGLGFFLSHASVNHWGGSIHLQERSQGGTWTVLRLPLQALGVSHA